MLINYIYIYIYKVNGHADMWMAPWKQTTASAAKKNRSFFFLIFLDNGDLEHPNICDRILILKPPPRFTNFGEDHLWDCIFGSQDGEEGKLKSWSIVTYIRLGRDTRIRAKALQVHAWSRIQSEQVKVFEDRRIRSDHRWQRRVVVDELDRAALNQRSPSHLGNQNRKNSAWQISWRFPSLRHSASHISGTTLPNM